MDRKEIIRQLNQLADKMDAKLAKKFLDSVQSLKGNIDWKQVEAFLEAGDYNSVLQLFSPGLTEASFTPFTVGITEAFIAGGSFVASTVPAFRSTATGSMVNVAFDIANPELTTVLHSYKMSLIREISNSTLEIVQDELRDSISGGINPIEASRRIRDTLGLTTHQRMAVERFRSELEKIGTSGDKTSRMALRNILQRKLRDRRFDAGVVEAVRSNMMLPSAQINKIVTRYQDRMLKRRAETVARTESIRALNMANQALWEQQVKDGKIEEDRVERLWIVTRDGHARDAHVYLGDRYGKTPKGVGLNEPFQSPLGPIRYPGDPNARAGNTINCRCTIFVRIRPLPSEDA